LIKNLSKYILENLRIVYYLPRLIYNMTDHIHVHIVSQFLRAKMIFQNILIEFTGILEF